MSYFCIQEEEEFALLVIQSWTGAADKEREQKGLLNFYHLVFGLTFALEEL